MINWNDVIKFANHGNPKAPRKIQKTDEEWRQQLTEDEYFITRKKGTERAHSSDLCTSFEEGKYACKCCDTMLFDSTEKFNSGSGWPSFTQPIELEHIAYNKDSSHGMIRVEAVCNICDAHLGHVFPDGPAPSGLRYCVNALSLIKEEDIKNE